MSGIFGIVDLKRGADIRRLADKMAESMSHREWFTVDRFFDDDDSMVLGRIGIGIFNREPQPFSSEEMNLVAFFTGEFYNTKEVHHNLESNGYRFRDGSDLELLLRLYKEKGIDFVDDLEGAFILAIWDRTQKRLTIANDRFGLYPLYYAHYDGKLAFAPEVKGILCDQNFRKKLNLTALAEYMRFQHLLGVKTFFEGINLLPKASKLLFELRTGVLTIEPYWDFSMIKPLPSALTFKEAVDETGRLVKRAVNRLASGPYRIGVFLSGGLDSRMISGFTDRENFPVVCITYGQSGSQDVIYAERIARKVKTHHFWHEFKNGEWVSQYADLHLDLTEGFHSWIHSHGISSLATSRSLIDVNLTGWGIDSLVGPYLDLGDRLLTDAPDQVAFLSRLFYAANQKYTWGGIDEAEERHLYTDSFAPKLIGRAFDSLTREVQLLSGDNNAQRAQCFYLGTHDIRLNHNHQVSQRSHFEIRYPGRDYSLFNFCWSLPAEIKKNRRLERAIIAQELPSLARIPVTGNQLLLTDNRLLWAAHALTHKVKRRFNRHVFPLFKDLPELYADYENYLRGDLHDWGKSILFDKRTLERGIFNPRFIHSIWARHQSGQELHTIGKIAPIMTYEMMLRRLFD